MKDLIILHISNTNIDNDNRILKEIYTLAQNKTYKIYCIGIDDGSKFSKNNSICSNLSISNIKLIFSNVNWIPRSLKYIFLTLELTLKFIVISLKYKPNIVHCHDTMVLFGGVIIKLINNSKLIYDAHELESNKAGQNYILSKTTFLIEKICWIFIDCFITVSYSISEWYFSKFKYKPSFIILNSPKIENNNNIDNIDIRTKFNIPINSLVFIYLGLLSKGRGIETIISSFIKEEIKSHVIFVGYGPLENKINQANLICDRIHLLPPVPHQFVVSLIKNADYGLCLLDNISLSDYYCLPNKLFEYSFAGLPIIASNFPEITNIIEKYKLGYVCEPNSQNLIEIIIKCQQNPKLIISTDLTEISWDAQSEKLHSCYNELIK